MKHGPDDELQHPSINNLYIYVTYYDTERI